MKNRRSSILQPNEISAGAGLPLLAQRCHLFAIVALAVGAVAPSAHSQDKNTAYGTGALGSGPTGNANSAFGYGALFTDKAGHDNTAVGSVALALNVDGSYNVAVGQGALNGSTTSHNTAVGFNALGYNGSGTDNTGLGYAALAGPTSGSSGSYNTATGFQSLYNNETGSYNAAMGTQSLFSNTSGYANTADGYQALYSNKTSAANTGIGFQALHNNQDGNNNTAVGDAALYSNVSGEGNVAIGVSALANSTGPGGNIAIGQAAGYNLTTGVGNIDIANQGVAGESGKIRIGAKGSQNATFIAGIFGKTVKNSTAVFINGNGQLGTVQSSARFKDDIQPMDATSEAILKLHPVTFHYKEELDPDHIPQFGLIAEDVEKVNPDLVVRDEDGKVSTVRYEAVNAMLLNEFLKARRKAQQEEQKVQELETRLAGQQRQIEALAAGLQKVTGREALGGQTAQRLVTND